MPAGEPRPFPPSIPPGLPHISPPLRSIKQGCVVWEACGEIANFQDSSGRSRYLGKIITRRAPRVRHHEPTHAVASRHCRSWITRRKFHRAATARRTVAMAWRVPSAHQARVSHHGLLVGEGRLHDRAQMVPRPQSLARRSPGVLVMGARLPRAAVVRRARLSEAMRSHL
jgi:hypothetical protein